MSLRLSKILLVASAGFYMALVCFNNLSDYGSNFAFVSHVLRMDDTFPGNRGMWRAIDAAPLHHTFYVLIILTEGLAAGLCFAGARRLWLQRNAPAPAFQQAKKRAILALTLGFLLWFTGFVSVGGEWFLMWQSQTWNGIQTAFQNAAISLLLLIFVASEQGENLT